MHGRQWRGNGHQVQYLQGSLTENNGYFCVYAFSSIQSCIGSFLFNLDLESILSTECSDSIDDYEENDLGYQYHQTVTYLLLWMTICEVVGKCDMEVIMGIHLHKKLKTLVIKKKFLQKFLMCLMFVLTIFSCSIRDLFILLC